MREMLPMNAAGSPRAWASDLQRPFIETQLFGVKAYDPPVILASVARFAIAALAAAAVPAWRASRIDSMSSMRISEAELPPPDSVSLPCDNRNIWHLARFSAVRGFCSRSRSALSAV